MRYSLLFFFLFACGSDYTPKPRAFFKIKFPQKEYQTFIDNRLVFTFLYPKYSKVEIEKNINFLNINFPQFSGKLYLTYVNLNNDLNEHIEQSRSLAYKHNDQADVISEQVFVNEENNIFGMLYDYQGVTATSSQFYLTDSLIIFLEDLFILILK
jgi:gliding motility-associated lipoprotein GldD